MKQITKTQEPHSLIEHRAKGGTYAGLAHDTKEELKNSLLAEQGNICCYCLCRIPHTLKQEEIEKHYPDCKIEHFECQSENQDKELKYSNLLLACNGKHGFPKQMQTCDTAKGEKELSFNPSDTTKNIEDFIKYSANGEIRSDNEIIDKELNEILNLNTLDLKGIRKVFYKDIQERIIREGKKKPGLNIQKRFYESEKQQLLTQKKGKFIPYCMIGVYLINKKLRRYN